MKYADAVMTWLRELGHTHCFFVAGGNSMHLLDGARRTMTCVPVVHEVAAGIAVEYFNEQMLATGRRDRAFALVTAGPGITNLLTAMAGAYLESRELLVLAGQVKSTDLAGPGLRQRGIQEVDGVALTSPVCVATCRVERPLRRAEMIPLLTAGSSGRKGPVFLEFCLDAQGARIDLEVPAEAVIKPPAESGQPPDETLRQVVEALHSSSRPVLLLGGGVSREQARHVMPQLRKANLPVMTTWNGTDRLGADDPVYAGRPNTWGQRSANVLLQQCDLLVALGTRLGIQQTGFNWEAFAPLATVVQVDLDGAELTKGHPKVDLPVLGDAGVVLNAITSSDLPDWQNWLSFCKEVRSLLPVVEAVNTTAAGYLDPYTFVENLSDVCSREDIIVPCSSGGAFTVTMQVFAQKAGQTVISDKGLASMGYGLSGAIGAAMAGGGRRTVLLEGDGGFSQNLQELATVAVNHLPVKIFLFSNEGYASIRMTQRNYFDGAYLGCDTSTGLGFPNWDLLFSAYDIPVLHLGDRGIDADGFNALFNAPGPAAFVVPVDPEQTYFPKITSRVTPGGGMESQPLHLMSPDLPRDVAARVFAYLSPEGDAATR